MTELTLGTAFIIGLLSTGHCLAMCGGLSCLLGVNGQETRSSKSFVRLLCYNGGRILSYGSLGALFGLLGQSLSSQLVFFDIALRILAGLLMIAMGLYISQWWTGLTQLEKLGTGLWKKLQPLTKKVLPVDSAQKALGLGLIWGFLPCGLVYTNLSWSLATADWLLSSLLMIAFGIGTMPAMLATGTIGNTVLKLFREKKLRLASSIMVIFFGIITILIPVKHLKHADHNTHQHHNSHQHAGLQSDSDETNSIPPQANNEPVKVGNEPAHTTDHGDQHEHH